MMNYFFKAKTMNNFQSPNFSEKLFQVIANPIAADFAIKRLAIHRAAAEMQNRRIWEANSVLKANRPELNASAWEAKNFIEDTQSNYKQLLFETHFYFVSWAKCGNMLRVLTGQNEFLEALKVGEFKLNLSAKRLEFRGRTYLTNC
jgi:hypothetical protein